MKLLIICTVLAATIASAQTTVAPFNVSVTIADQGPDAINYVVGSKVPTARLLDATACNWTPTDQVVDNSMLYERVDAASTQGITLYDSQLVVLVLAVLQDKNVWAKLYKGGVAASMVGAILLTAFKLSPIGATALLIAPQIFAAVLPVVHSPVDLAALSANVIQQNSAFKLAGMSCHSGLVIGRTTAAVKTEVIPIQ